MTPINNKSNWCGLIEYVILFVENPTTEHNLGEEDTKDEYAEQEAATYQNDAISSEDTKVDISDNTKVADPTKTGRSKICININSCMNFDTNYFFYVTIKDTVLITLYYLISIFYLCTYVGSLECDCGMKYSKMKEVFACFTGHPETKKE